MVTLGVAQPPEARDRERGSVSAVPVQSILVGTVMSPDQSWITDD